jgi:hypothetical protein
LYGVLQGLIVGHRLGIREGVAMSVTDQALVIERAHKAAVQATLQEMAATLQDVLSRSLTAYVANVRDGKTVTRWTKGEVDAFRDRGTEQRVRTAYEIIALLRESERPQAMRAWFIHINHRLNDSMPAEAIREGRLQDALSAAQAFIANP